MLLDRYCFSETLNLVNGTFTLSFTISAFQILALTVEKDWVPSETRNISFVLVL